MSSPVPDLISERPGTYPRKISRRSLPPPPPPPRTSSLYSLSPHASSLSTRSPSTSSLASFTSILAIRPGSESSPNLFSRPSVLSPIDVDIEVFSPTRMEEGGQPPIQIPGSGPPTVLSPVDVDSAVEKLALSVRRISEEQDALFNIFRSGGHVTGGGEEKGKKSNSRGSGKEEDKDNRGQIREDTGRLEEASNENIEEGIVTKKVEIFNEECNGEVAARELNKMSKEHEENATNLKSKGSTNHTEQVKSEDKSEEKKKNQKHKYEKKKRRPPLFVDIPSVETEMGKENPPKEEMWSVSIPIMRTDEGSKVEKEDRVNDALRRRREPEDETSVNIPIMRTDQQAWEEEKGEEDRVRREADEKRKIKSVNIPILRSINPEKVKLEKLDLEEESGRRCNNDDGTDHSGFPATRNSADVSDEMRRVISKLRRVKGELERESVDQSEGKPSRIVDGKPREPNEVWSDTDSEDYIEATGPMPDLERAASGVNLPGPMSPLVSQIVEIRQFIKNFRRSVAGEESLNRGDPNSFSNNSEAVEVSGERSSSEKSSPNMMKRSSFLRERKLNDQNGRNRDQDQERDGRDQDGKGGLFWASPALVKEEDENKESEEGSDEEEKEEGARSSFHILPSSPKNALPVIAPRNKKVSVTSFTMKKVSVTSPEWNSDNHHSFVHLI